MILADARHLPIASGVQPYYEEDGIAIWHGDCREILPALGALAADVIVTDPVWPNSSPRLVGAERPFELFAEAARYFGEVASRAIVQMGCDSDPRMLRGMSMPFLRVCWLEYACPTRKGRLLYTGDVAYVFGRPPASRPGRRLMPGRVLSTKPDSVRTRVSKHKEWGKAPSEGHPTPRRLQHAQWLVARFSDGVVLDPFAGSGTTLLAAKNAGYPAIGIEIEERWCELAARRLSQRVLEFQAETFA